MVTNALFNYAEIISFYIALYQKRLAVENDDQQELFWKTITPVISGQTSDAFLIIDNGLKATFKRNSHGFIFNMIFTDHETAQEFWQQIIEGTDLLEESDLRKAAESQGSLGFRFMVMSTMAQNEINGSQITIRLPEALTLEIKANKYAPN